MISNLPSTDPEDGFEQRIIDLSDAILTNQNSGESTDSELPEGGFDDIEYVLAERLAERGYRDIKRWKEGGTRVVFTATWGPAREKRVIKVDKMGVSSASPRARRHIDRGCVTENDVETLATIPEAEEHGLMRLLDYGDLTDQGRGAFVVEPYFESQSLESLVESEGPIPFDKGKNVFGKVFRAAQYFARSTGKLHRDPNPGNILIGTGENEGKIRITDFANAKPANALETKYLPTAGSVAVTDWQLYSPLTGKNAAYSEQSEVYAYGMSYLFARTGKPFVTIDPDSGTAIALDTNESLLNGEGIIDEKKYEQALERALKPLPQKEVKFVRKALTSQLTQRFSSLDDLVDGFEKLHKPGLGQRIKQHWRPIASAVAATSLGLGTLGYFVAQDITEKNNQTLAEKVEDAQRYPVSSEWNGVGPELISNLVDLDVFAYVSGKEGYSEYPKSPYLKAKAGQSINVRVETRDLPRVFNTAGDRLTGAGAPSLAGRVYIEGLPFQFNPKLVTDDLAKGASQHNAGVMFAKGGNFADPRKTAEDISLYRNPIDITQTFGDMGGGNFGSYLALPDSLPDGVYIMAVEAYEPPKELIQDAQDGWLQGSSNNSIISTNLNNFRFSHPDKILARKRIPIVVGEPTFAPDIKYVKLSWLYQNEVFFSNLLGSEKYSPGVLGVNPNSTDFNSMQIRVPEENYVWTHISKDSDYSHTRVVLPDAVPKSEKDLEQRTMEVTIRDISDRTILYTALPIQRELVFKDTEGKPTYQWTLSRWDKKASEFMVGRRPDLDYTQLNPSGDKP